MVSRNALLQPMLYGFKTTKPRHLKAYQTVMSFYKIKSVSKLFYIYTHKIHWKVNHKTFLQHKVTNVHVCILACMYQYINYRLQVDTKITLLCKNMWLTYKLLAVKLYFSITIWGLWCLNQIQIGTRGKSTLWSIANTCTTMKVKHHCIFSVNSWL